MSEGLPGEETDSSTSTSDKDFSECPTCGKEYTSTSGLKYHLKTDSNECRGKQCHICGESHFINSRALGWHMNNSHNGEPPIDKERLEELYIETGLGARGVASEIGVSKTTVIKYLRYYNISVEKPVAKKPPTHTFDRISDTVGHEYERVKPNIDGKTYSIHIHRLVAIAHGKMSPENMWNSNIHVHHKTKHGLDNRPENLEVMNDKEHISMHNSKSR